MTSNDVQTRKDANTEGLRHLSGWIDKAKKSIQDWGKKALGSRAVNKAVWTLYVVATLVFLSLLLWR